MKDKLKLFASDVDKTLIFENDNIPDEIKRNVLEFQKKSNNKFTLVTGRNYFLTKQIAKELDIKLPIVTSNGAALVDPTNDEILYLNYIDVQKCIDLIKQFANDNVDITLYSEFEMFCLESSKWSKTFSPGSTKYNQNYFPILHKFKNYFEIIDYLNSSEISITRVLLDFASIDEAKLGDKKLNKKILSSILYISNKQSVIEVFNKNTNKANGIEKLTQRLGISNNQVAVFGDQINDIEIFEKYKYSFAVDNAIEVLKELAFEIIDSVYNFGVGKQLIQLLKYLD